jgi:adenylate cyclase
MTERNAEVPEEKRIEFRIGINLGDIILDDDDIYGDGVNVAARLEALAEPGGICVSRVVHDQVARQARPCVRGSG